MEAETVRTIAIAGSALVALVSVGLSWRATQIARKENARSEKSKRASDYFVTWPTSNFSLFNEDDIADLEAKMHPYGDIGRTEIRKIYYFFEMLNRTYAAFHDLQLGGESDEYIDSMIDNICNVTFQERDFIRTHVLPRGYSKKFQDFMNGKWTEIEARGTWPSSVLEMS